MLHFGFFCELHMWSQDVIISDQREFLQVEINPGAINKILFICLTTKENHGSGAILFEGQNPEVSFLVKFWAV